VSRKSEHRLHAACSVAQSCPTLCNPMDYSPPGSSVHGILLDRFWSRLPFPSTGSDCELLGQRDEEVTLGFRCWHGAFWASQVALVVKNLPANEET